ncbi:chondroitinase-B domain-containing protein [Mariniflexile soesokkakense]|uniref:Chondroitinase-B domain-containing protein n=1 Tax=Mariniflexile soesokkakense TaxID=1343160 RepID=A0ABV0ABG0_9FLAO
MKKITSQNFKGLIVTKQLLQKHCCILIMFICSSTIFSQTYVTNKTDLQNAVLAAAPGDVIIVRNGTYSDFSPTLKPNGSAGNPIIIKAETIGGVTLTGSSRFTFNKSAHAILEGFTFNCTGNSTMVKLEGCHNIRITRNVFETAQTSSSKWVLIGGVYDDTTAPYQYLSHDNRIDHNIFQNKTMPGHYITVDGTNEIIQSQNDRIDHNYFKNNGPRAVNEQESIRIGWSNMSLSSGYTTVEFNLFEDCDGDPEIVSVKSCDNVVRHNTFLRSYGTLSLRHGNRNRIEGNYFFGGNKPIGSISYDGGITSTTLYTGGIRIYGTDHVIINNYMEGLNGTRWDAPITLTQGDVIDGQSTSLSSHFRAERVTIAYNTLVNNSHGIEIGFNNNGAYNKALSNIKILNNLITGSENGLIEIKDNNDQGSNITWTNNLLYPTGSAQTIIGATSTTLNTSNVNENPFLTFNSDTGVWKTTVNTPNYNNVVTTETINEDIEGQTRTNSSNPGADHYSLESVRYAPMTPDTVGPNAYEVDDTSESMYLTSVTGFASAGGSQTVTVTSNVNWVVSPDTSWITVTPTSGTNNGSFDVTTSQNTTFSERTGIVTVTGGALTRTLNISQAAADPRDGLNLINVLATDVEVNYVSNEEVNGTTKFNYAINSLDKDFNTQWASNGTLDPNGSGFSILIYDLKGAFDLDLVDIATTNGKTYKLQIWVSSTGTADEDFTNAFPPDNVDLISNTNASFKSFILPAPAIDTKYVKLIGKGQASSTFTTIHEIEFYGNESTLSVNDNDLTKQVKMYPNPVKDILTLSHIKTSVNSIQIFNIDGRKVLERPVKLSENEIKIDVSSFSNGAYILNIINNDTSKHSKMIIVSH